MEPIETNSFQRFSRVSRAVYFWSRLNTLIVCLFVRLVNAIKTQTKQKAKWQCFQEYFEPQWMDVIIQIMQGSAKFLSGLIPAPGFRMSFIGMQPHPLLMDCLWLLCCSTAEWGHRDGSHGLQSPKYYHLALHRKSMLIPSTRYNQERKKTIALALKCHIVKPKYVLA